MSTVICRHCRFANLGDALHCVSCDSPLGEAKHRASGAIWLDTSPSTFDVGTEDPAEPVTLTLRDVEPAPAAGGSTSDLPVLNDTPVTSDGPAPQPLPALVDDEAWLAAERAAKRAFVRRARRRTRSDASASPPLAEVLVFDRDPVTRERLFGLLTGFGFGVLAAANVTEAAAMAAERYFVAAFIDVTLGTAADDPGLALCHQIKSVQAPPGSSPTLLVWLGSKLRTVERVRAELAGCDALLVKPLTRGDVARVLDKHDIAMPADPRQT